MLTTIEFIYFEGCPNADEARANLRSALLEAGLPPHWHEWDQNLADTPQRIARYPSPTILVNGRDLAGTGADHASLSCRLGAPLTIDAIRRALTGLP